MSPHNPSVLYVGGDRFFKSLDRGDHWTASADLSKHIDRNTLSIMGVKGTEPMASKNDGYTSYGYVVTIGESPMVPGIVWVGTDDGNVQISRDGGMNWTNVSKNIHILVDKGELYHITRVEPSRFDAELARGKAVSAAGKSAEATKVLEALLAEAKKFQYLGYEFQARLALGEAEIKARKTAAGRTRLAALQKDAEAKGYLLIARKALKAAS